VATFDRQRLLVKIAHLYYEQELTQSEISSRLRLSRQKVQRLLREARDQGVVRINIRPVIGAHTELEKSLEQRIGLHEAIVVETAAYDEQSVVTREIGAGAAEYLLRVLQPHDVIVISWGSSLLGMVESLQANGTLVGIEGVTVVQGLGGLGDPINETHATELTRSLAKVLGGQALLLPAPGVAGTLAARQAFQNDPFVARALKQGARANLALMGIGAPRPDSILCRQSTIVSWPDIAKLQKQGAVGDINLRYYDDHGFPVTSDLDNRVIGLTLEEIRKIERVVGVAGGSDKFAAIKAALKRNIVDILVTDHMTAQRLLSDI
jgi:DNA-binding transcriptional regulator LsrR (DeoR family)